MAYMHSFIAHSPLPGAPIRKLYELVAQMLFPGQEPTQHRSCHSDLLTMQVSESSMARVFHGAEVLKVAMPFKTAAKPADCTLPSYLP